MGNTTADAVQGSLNAGNAVENNYVVSIISKGRRAVRAAQTGRGLTPKDALPVAEAGLLVAAACLATRNCDASQVLQDIWSGKFEDSYMASDNENNGSGEKASVQSAVSQTSAGSPMPDPDFEPNGESKTHNRDSNTEVNELLNNSTQRSNRNSLSQYDRNLTNQQNAWQQANKDFDSLKLRNVRTFQTRYGQGRIGTLSDGRIVNVRPGSSNGQTTIEIQNPTSNRVVKIRY